MKITKYKKKNGEYAYSYNAYMGINPLTGKRTKVRKQGFSTEREARASYTAEFAKYVNEGPKLETNIKTFEQLYEMWLKQYRLEVKPSSVAVARRYTELHILPKFGNLPLDKITVTYCQRCVNEWYDKYLQFNYIRKQASKIMKFGVNQEIMKSNPMAKVSIPKEKERLNPDNYYNREQVLEFLEWAKKYPNKKGPKNRVFTYFRLLAFTGMRKSEALALQWRDIDFDKKLLDVHKTLAIDEFSKVLIQEPKTKNSRRTISIDDETLRILKEYQLDTLQSSEGNPQDRFIFRQVDDSVCYPQIANEWMKDIYRHINNFYDRKLSAAQDVLENSEDIAEIKQARIDAKRYATHFKRITPHGFRHTHASLMFESAINANIPGDSILKEVMDRLGHKDIKTTMNIYAHVTQTSKEKVSHLFADFMNDSTPRGTTIGTTSPNIVKIKKL